MAKRLPLPSADLIQQLLHYDPLSGMFTWLVSRGGVARKGAIAGCARPCGHIVIKIGCIPFMAHRLAWVIMTGSDPELDPDHENGEPGDNRWSNLRPATFSQNRANSRRAKNNKSGFKGVSWNEREQKWVAQICENKRVKHLGYFETPEAAHAVYLTAAKQTFGQYARAA